MTLYDTVIIISIGYGVVVVGGNMIPLYFLVILYIILYVMVMLCYVMLLVMLLVLMLWT